MTKKLRLLSLFAGIGGFDLGLERTGGFESVAFCEIEPFPQKILKKHWPKVKIYDDVKSLTAERLNADGIHVDAICGGFPCQDLSAAGRMAGMGEGTRSGLVFDFLRLIDELRPKVVYMENVANLLVGHSGEWFGRLLIELAKLGYDAEWQNIPAAALGFEHGRERIWIVAYPSGGGLSDVLASHRLEKAILRFAEKRGNDQLRFEVRATASRRVGNVRKEEIQPRLGGRSDGLSPSVVRGGVKAFGNAVVPDIPEILGYATLDAMAA